MNQTILKEYQISGILYVRLKQLIQKDNSTNLNGLQEAVLFFVLQKLMKNKQLRIQQGKRFKIVRKRNKLTQEELGSKVSVTGDKIRHIEAGRNDLEADLLLVLKENNIDFDTDWLLFGYKELNPAILSKLRSVDLTEERAALLLDLLENPEKLDALIKFCNRTN